ncbi:MAG: hypothetical protein ACYSWW_26615 [Planctomycetota bacterium]
MKYNENLLHDGINVTCDCGNMFQVPRSMKGGIANCPRCQKTVNVPGGPEGLFYVLLFAGIAIVAGISALFFAASTTAGLIALAIGCLVILICVLAF